MKHVRNVKAGLRTRTKLIAELEKKSHHAKGLSKKASLSYSVILHHLRLLESEDIVNRKGKRPYFWNLTGLGQKQLLK